MDTQHLRTMQQDLLLMQQSLTKRVHNFSCSYAGSIQSATKSCLHAEFSESKPPLDAIMFALRNELQCMTLSQSSTTAYGILSIQEMEQIYGAHVETHNTIEKANLLAEQVGRCLETMTSLSVNINNCISKTSVLNSVLFMCKVRQSAFEKEAKRNDTCTICLEPLQGKTVYGNDLCSCIFLYDEKCFLQWTFNSFDGVQSECAHCRKKFNPFQNTCFLSKSTK